MRTGAVVGVEALIRWRHPERGLLAPGAFLPIIEGHALIIELGEWVLDTAMAQSARWKAQGIALPISVNVDALQLQQPDFIDRLGHLRTAHPTLQAGDLELEVLETGALEDFAQATRVVLACQAMGIEFALDDFGTGYSSLTYLKRLPANLLKIDQSFVLGMLDDPDDRAILEGILGLSRAFRRKAIAEGVETVAHGEKLLHLGCELGQGYAIARPMPADALPGWLAGWQVHTEWRRLAPANREDLPVRFAAVEHRVWFSGLMDYLAGQRDEPPSLLDDHLCRFGQWLDDIGVERHPELDALRRAGDLHRQLHEVARKLIRMKRSGDVQGAVDGIGEIQTLRDALIDQLDSVAR